jgi:hypothetical protein
MGSFGNFIITTYDSTGAEIDYYSGGSLSLTINQTKDLKSVSISTGDQVNGSKTTYTFSIMTETSLINGDKM